MADMPWDPSWKLLTDYRFWTVLYLFIEIPLCLLRSLRYFQDIVLNSRSISFASLGSVIVMILCCIVIIMYTPSSILDYSRSYGAVYYGFSWDNQFLHVDSAFEIGKCFGLLSFGLAVNCLVPSSYVSFLSLCSL